MRKTVSVLPDKMLHLAQMLPWPINSLMFRALLNVFKSYGRATGTLTRIRFGSIEIVAPLEHPAVYWRYRPVGFNLNYLLVVKHILTARPGLIVDVGANIGDGVALIRAADIDAPILAIEGADIWFDLLQSNTKGLPGVSLEHVLLGTGEQENDLALHVHDGTSQLVKTERGVPITSLDVVMARYPEHPVVLLKTDTDGFDARVLIGGRSLLKTQHPVIFAEVDEGLLRIQGNSAQQLLDHLSDCGYSLLIAWNNGGQMLSSRPLSRGLSDLIAKYPGGPDTSYLDVAAFTESDRGIFEAVKGGSIDAK